MILAHRVQLQPRKKHVVAFTKACGCARYAYNWALEQWTNERKAGGNPKIGELKKRWNKEKPAWVYESPKDANQQPFANLQRAFTRFFKKQARYPKFKVKGRNDRFYVSNDKFSVHGRYVRLPRIGRVKMTESLRFSGKIMSATVSREADRWFISFQVDVTVKPKRGKDVIGVDLGVKDAVVLSDGHKYVGPKPLRRKLRLLRKRQRKHSRKRKHSNNRRKSAICLARLHRKIKNQRKDFLHKVTSHIVSRAKTVVIEDLNVQGMLKNRNLARAISDVGFYELRRQLEYKCQMNSVELIVADKWFPSTKLCVVCGRRNDMPLSKRVFKCVCGYTADRDVNAAQNLRTLGLGGTNACGHGSSGLDLGDLGETTVDEAGTQSLVTDIRYHI